MYVQKSVPTGKEKNIHFNNYSLLYKQRASIKVLERHACITQTVMIYCNYLDLIVGNMWGICFVNANSIPKIARLHLIYFQTLNVEQKVPISAHLTFHLKLTSIFTRIPLISELILLCTQYYRESKVCRESHQTWGIRTMSFHERWCQFDKGFYLFFFFFFSFSCFFFLY